MQFNVSKIFLKVSLRVTLTVVHNLKLWLYPFYQSEALQQVVTVNDIKNFKH